MSSKLFRDPLTFLDLPRSTNFIDANVAILGVPFDCARDLTRFGPRQGPNAVRHASVLTRNLMEDADPFPLDSIRVVDAGNVDLPMDDIDEAFAQIEAAMDSILQAGCIPIAVGGDGSVSLPQMRSLHRKYGEFALLHFDAHTDTWEVPESGHHSNANQFTFANTEALIICRPQCISAHAAPSMPVVTFVMPNPLVTGLFRSVNTARWAIRSFYLPSNR